MNQMKLFYHVSHNTTFNVSVLTPLCVSLLHLSIRITEYYILTIA